MARSKRWIHFRRAILQSKDRWVMVSLVADLLRQAGNCVLVSSANQLDLIVNRRNGDLWGVCCFRHAPYCRLTEPVVRELRAIYQETGVDRLIVFTLNDFLSPAARELDNDPRILIMHRPRIERLYRQVYNSSQ